jgi:hypothetical protein
VTPQAFAISPVVYFDIAFTSFRHASYNMTLRNKQYITQGDFSKNWIYCEIEIKRHLNSRT